MKKLKCGLRAWKISRTDCALVRVPPLSCSRSGTISWQLLPGLYTVKSIRVSVIICGEIPLSSNESLALVYRWANSSPIVSASFKSLASRSILSSWSRFAHDVYPGLSHMHCWSLEICFLSSMFCSQLMWEDKYVTISFVHVCSDNVVISSSNRFWAIFILSVTAFTRIVAFSCGV